jgi:hypothetical protein
MEHTSHMSLEKGDMAVNQWPHPFYFWKSLRTKCHPMLNIISLYFKWRCLWECHLILAHCTGSAVVCTVIDRHGQKVQRLVDRFLTIVASASTATPVLLLFMIVYIPAYLEIW